jgi:spoIIIJ-associated protein
MSAIEITAHDIETAIKIGLAQLNLLRAEVKIEVLDEGNKGVLGIGSRPARVRLTPFVETEEAPAAPPVEERRREAPPGRAEPAQTDAEVETPDIPPAAQAIVDTMIEETPAADADADTEEDESDIGDDAVQLAATLAQGVLDRMDFQVTCASRPVEPSDHNESRSIWVDIQGRDASRLLSHQCEALDSLQLVVQTMWAHQTKSNTRITLDADSYKERREKRIRQMAERLAERVVSTGRAITLEPMPPSERRLVHIALRDHPRVSTESHGEGAGRRVTIKLK